MHIAVVNCFPCLPSSAELEYTKRLIRAAGQTGHSAYEVVTSDDILACQPDFVLTTHEFTPKLTPFFTVGALWSPPAFCEGDPRRIKSVLSYDGYLVGSPQVGQFLDDLEFASGVRKPRAEFRFLPTALRTEFVPRPSGQPYELVYVGVQWDGMRHGPLLAGLCEADAIALYGPPHNWRNHARCYRGAIPFDGVSIGRTLASHGIALCLHKDEHRAADTPSMRLFEAAAAGCLIIADEIPFARQVLGDSAFYVDLRNDPRETLQQVVTILRWANDNPGQANAMAERSHYLLRKDYSIETLLARCCDFVAEAKAGVAARQSAAVISLSAGIQPTVARAQKSPLVDIIVRTGGRELAPLRRALRSVAAQSSGCYRVILADYKNRADVCALAVAERTPDLHIKHLPCPDTGLRSTTLWTALREVTAPFFAMLDDDDSIMPDHLPSLLDLADRHPDYPLYYSGTVRVEEEPGDYLTAPNFTGPLEIEVRETRELKFLDQFSLPRLVAFDNYIQSNAWIARSELLDERTLSDPHMSVGEDMYLYFMLARAGRFKFSCSPTAYWHWRSSSRDNSMMQVDQEVWARDGRRLVRRLGQEIFPGGRKFSELRQLINNREIGADQVWPTPQGKLPIGIQTFLTPAVIAHARQLNLHGAEANGVWTGASDAHVQIRLAEPVRSMRFRLQFMAASGPARDDQMVQLSVNGQQIFCGPVAPWESMEVEHDFNFLPTARALFIRARCTRTFKPSCDGVSQDHRQLGLYLSSITCSHLIRPSRSDARTEATA